MAEKPDPILESMARAERERQNRRGQRLLLACAFPFVVLLILFWFGVFRTSSPVYSPQPISTETAPLFAKPIPAVRSVKPAERPVKLATVAMVRRRIKLGMTGVAVHHALRRIDAPNDGITYAMPMGVFEVDNYQCSDGYVTVYYTLDTPPEGAIAEGISWPNHHIGVIPPLP